MQFQLSQSKLNTSKQGSGLQANTISSTKAASVLSTPSLSVNAGQTQFTPSRIPKVVQDQTSPAIQNFMGVVAESAFRYQERESTFQAKELILQYQKAAQDALAGTIDSEGRLTKGYAQTQGMQALAEFGNLQNKSEELFNNMLNGSPENVRQKALIQMHGIKSSLMNKAAEHRTRQLGLAEKEQQQLRTKQIAAQIALDPSSIYQTIPGTNGSNLKKLYYSGFSSQLKGDDAWFSMMEDATQQVFVETEARLLASDKPEERAQATEIAYATVENFVKQVSGPETLGSQSGHRVRILADVRRWRGEANSAYVSRVKESEKLFEKQNQETKALNGSKLILRIEQGNPPSGDTIINMQKAGLINPATARTAIKSLNSSGGKSSKGTYDAELITAYEEMLYEGKDVRESIFNSDLPPTEKTKLNTLFQNVRKPSFNQQGKRISTHIRSLVMKSVGQLEASMGIYDAEIKHATSLYEDIAFDMINDGIPYATIVEKMEEQILKDRELETLGAPSATFEQALEVGDTKSLNTLATEYTETTEGVVIDSQETWVQQAAILKEMEETLGEDDPETIAEFKAMLIKAGDKFNSTFQREN